ncbi:MAG TPA: ABC transporter permease, partial [Candidatus Krumholzibacterium sp.]|nr:ABC transporter permease [Candidatus Krumholzibacterium sp.]
ACCIFILAFILHELSYDRFHENSDRIVRVAIDATIAGKNIQVATVPAPMGPQLVEDFPEVVDAARFRQQGTHLLKYGDRQFTEEKVLYVDDSFFDVFSLKLIEGDPATALQAPWSMVLTPETAEKYFGDEDAVGRTLSSIDGDVEFKITGIVEAPPTNSHFSYELLASFETLIQSGRNSVGWFNFNYQTYLLLAENAAAEDIEAKMDAFNDKYLGEFLRAIGGEVSYIIQPLTSIHLGSNLENELEANGDIRYVYAFAAIGVFILFIACINFMNLSTARSAGRAKEVGLRKVLGAEKSRLVAQFMGESFFMALLSMALAIILVILFKPYFQQLAGQDVEVVLLSDPLMVGGLLFLLLFVGFAAGSYPALYLSAFTPSSVLKGTVRQGTGNNRLRRVLVVFQFAISIALIISTGIISGQIDFMRNTNLGFEKQQVL